jgi:hypothetical protein
MILFNNKTKIEWEWDKFLKRIIKKKEQNLRWRERKNGRKEKNSIGAQSLLHHAHTLNRLKENDVMLPTLS